MTRVVRAVGSAYTAAPGNWAPASRPVRAADAILRESGSPYTLPALISALDEVINQLTRATHQAIAGITSSRQDPARL
jgi:uncharacterized protein YbjT (DUF2867 family)